MNLFSSSGHPDKHMNTPVRWFQRNLLSFGVIDASWLISAHLNPVCPWTAAPRHNQLFVGMFLHPDDDFLLLAFPPQLLARWIRTDGVFTSDSWDVCRFNVNMNKRFDFSTFIPPGSSVCVWNYENKIRFPQKWDFPVWCLSDGKNLNLIKFLSLLIV